jgi:murein DD-endopeptidase MepM/ murein hydrolase activator NlpD
MATNLPFTGRFKVTCEYGRKGNWAAGRHTGIDLVGLSSKTVYATCDGTVSKTGFDNSYGNFVVIRGDDRNYHWLCHLASTSVSVGQRVSRVTKVGIMGSTGNSTGPHTHYEIRTPDNRYGEDINPATYMGIPNKVGLYHSSEFPYKEQKAVETVETVEYYPASTLDTRSIVMALEDIGVDSSKENRKKIAIKNGIEDYTGTAPQNTTLLKKLKAGNLIKI